MRALALMGIVTLLLGITCCLSAYGDDAPTKKAAALARLNACLEDKCVPKAPEAKHLCPCGPLCNCPGCCCGDRCEAKGRLVVYVRVPFVRLWIDWRRRHPVPAPIPAPTPAPAPSPK